MVYGIVMLGASEVSLATSSELYHIVSPSLSFHSCWPFLPLSGGLTDGSLLLLRFRCTWPAVPYTIMWAHAWEWKYMCEMEKV